MLHWNNVAASSYHQRIFPTAPKSKCQSRTHLTRSTPQLLKAKLSQHFNSSEHSTNFNSFQHFTKHEQERWKDRNLNTPKSVESCNTCAIDCLCVMKLCLCSWTSLARRYKYTKAGHTNQSFIRESWHPESPESLNSLKKIFSKCRSQRC